MIYNNFNMKNKLRKSMIRSKPNNQLSKFLTFLPLVEFKNGKMALNQQGLQVLQQQTVGKTLLIAAYCNKPILMNKIYRNNNMVNQQRNSSGIWITNFPRYDSETGVQYLYLQTFVANKEDIIKVHMICSLICSVILIDVDEITNISFLPSIDGRIIYNPQQKDQLANNNNRIQELAQIVFIKKSKNRQSSVEATINSKEASELMKANNIQSELSKIYGEQIFFINASNNILENNNSSYVELFEKKIKQLALFKYRKNQDLTQAPILRQYLEIIVKSIQSKGSVEILSSVNSIQISDGYNAYLKAVQYYHDNFNGNIKEEGVPQLKQFLKTHKQDTIEEYRKYSQDGQYLIKLNEYMEQKEEKLVQENNKHLDVKNINFLKQKSEQLITRVSKQKLGEEQAQKQIDKLIGQYNNKAEGDNKYKILSNYLGILNSTVYKNVSDRQIKTLKSSLQSTKKEKREQEERAQELEIRIRQMENSKKCCQIM